MVYGRGFWPLGPLLLLCVALTLFAVPTRFEGSVVLPVSPGHGLSTVDLLAAVPLMAGATWLEVGLWRRRRTLLSLATRQPGTLAIWAFAGGLGLGLLLASAFSTFWWWWAVGAALFATMLVVAAVASTSGQLEEIAGITRPPNRG